MEYNRDTSASTGQLSSASSTAGGMHHSLSTPAGVDGGARTPPATPKKGGKMLAIRVQMLDDTITIFQVQAKATGRVLFDQVCKQLHLLEADYFGLEYQDITGTKYWLDLQKPISRQLGLSLVDPLLQFCVKFYTPDPAQLEEEYTRYLFCLQVKRDLSHGLLQCNDNTAAVMASYIVQAECGDYVSEDYPDHTYLSSYKFVPHQDDEMERRIMENHKKHAAQSPAEADLNLLETARRCELYGMKMHPAKDHENVPLNLAVAHMGIVVFQNYTKINTFSWAKIRKISFKRKRFLIKLHPEGYGYYKDIVEFFFEGRNECKNFWKKCVENHGFFRCSSVKTVARHKTRVISRGSSFRYSGRTQKQIVEFVRDNYVKRQAFQRSASFRHSSAHSSATNMHTSTVGNSISAHPLLPLADSTLSVEAPKLSASLGSMDVTAETQVFPTTKSASRHPATAISWSSVPDTRPTTLFAQTTTSPSPPLTTQSASPVTSATTSPQHAQIENQRQGYNINNNNHTNNNIPVAVHAAVHRDDTGIIRTHTITAPTPSNRKLKDKLDQPSPVLTNNYPSQTQSQNDLDSQTSSRYTYKSIATQSKRKIWQRSSSCRELYDYSFEESGQAKRRVASIKSDVEKAFIMEERKLESPVTRYDDHRNLYNGGCQNNLEMHQDIMVCDHKVYSSSFPGTTSFSQESMEDPGNYDLRDSQDDLSHDSYELLEKSDDDFSMSGDYNKYQKSNKSANVRSCSLDSGNYLPSDADSDADYKQKCKSSTDLLQDDVLILDDPRDYPREKNPRKSDGSFYKSLKMGSRASSLESRSGDYYDTRVIRGERRTSREGSFGSRTSSQESKSDSENRNSKIKTFNGVGSKHSESHTSSFDSKSDYFDAGPKDDMKQIHEYDRKIPFERNYGIQKVNYNNVIDEINQNANNQIFKETSHVHSISLQNVETDSKHFNHILDNFECNTFPKMQSAPPTKSSENGHIKSLKETKSKSQKSTESESNIFSFDEERIQFIQDIDASVHANHTETALNLENQQKATESNKRDLFRDIFREIEPKHLEKGRDGFPLHQPIERTKSDPNSLARQRLSSNARRHLLMHQKSIDLTPAESSDDDYIYRQIPSAPPCPKYRGSHFEMPTAEFGHFDILKREFEGQKTKFEVPKSQFEVLGAKTQSDLINLPPKDDIPYTLHKRHIMNGTATKEESMKIKETVYCLDEIKGKQKKPKSPVVVEPEPCFLFTQNIDLSKVDPVTLEVDKSKLTIQHTSSPKRDITRIDPVLLETLNSKLSQIESDSPTSSKTESLKPDSKLKPPQKIIPDLLKSEFNKHNVDIVKPKIEIKILKDKIKTDIKPKRIAKSRSQQLNKKGIKSSNRTKVRITSFSSDDESLDSDDVFGSAEATPTKLEFSPPQTRKEMESILKYEAERKYLQYTMSSTEVEGSPPQTRKTEILQLDRSLDPNYQTELRRISERSISIPSSEDDFNVATADLQPVFTELTPDTELATVPEVDKSADSTICEHLSDNETLNTVKIVEEAVLLQELPEESGAASDKALLQSDIERDLKDLQVPQKTKITEICSPTSRRRGQSSFLFSHARLNLSEGSAFTMLQKQQATESPASGRRAKSLDAPVISVRQLPALNAISSKDDTVEEEDEQAVVENQVESKVSPPIKKPVETNGKVKPEKIKSSKPVEQSKPATKSKPTLKPKSKITNKDKDQIVPDVSTRKKTSKLTVSTNAQRVEGRSSKAVSAKRSASSKEVKTDSKEKLPLKQSSRTPPKVPIRTVSQKPPANVPTATKPKLERTATIEPTLETAKSLPTQLTLNLPETKEIKRAKSQEIESAKKVISKEKAKSLDKLEFKRERLKSQDDSDTDIAKRKEKQQMLYEIAIQQSKTIKSPIKDVLPVFPQVEESVRERHGKLEISINTIENTNVSLEEAIIITKSPKRLDKKMDKNLTKSLELNVSDREDDGVKTVQRLGKSLDLENRPKESEIQFDFDIQSTFVNNEEESPETKESVLELVEAEIHKQPPSQLETKEEEVVLEGTSLDIWLSIEDKDKPKSGNLENIVVIQKSSDFFEERSRPPDLNKTDTKSSSDSHSLEKTSLGNSLDIKYIDDSGDSSHVSDKDAEIVNELKKASNTVGKFLSKKIEKRRQLEREKQSVLSVPDSAVVRITSEDESLTEISELKCELDANLLGVRSNNHKDALLKLSIERSRSEDTGSWITVECDEYIGVEDSFDFDGAPLESPEKTSGEVEKSKVVQEVTPPNEDQPVITEDKVLQIQIDLEETGKSQENINLLTTVTRHSKIDLLKRSSDQSRSSDTTGSWTSGEKDLSPGNLKETGDESSVSYTMGQTIGLSQTIEIFGTRDQLDKNSPDQDVPRSPRSPRICVLGRTFTIDEDSNMQRRSRESSSDEGNEFPNEITPIQEADESKVESVQDVQGGVKYKKSRYPFEEKWSSDSELGQRIHQRIAKKLSSAEKSVSSLDESFSEKRTRNGKNGKGRSLLGIEKLSADSRSSLDTESSSGSLGIAVRMQKTGEVPAQEASSTWRPFPLESSGSSSLEEGILPQDQDQEKEYFVSAAKVDADVTPTQETSETDELSNFPTNFGYPCLTSNMGLGATSNDVLGGYGAAFLGRTLSRISERSTNSEKSSLDEDSTKASTQLDSLNGDSLTASDRQGSISSDSPSHAHVSDSEKKTPTNEIPVHKKLISKISEKRSEHFSHLNNLLLQRQISDDRRTSAEMAELSIDDIEIITSESGIRLRRQDSDDTVIDEELFEAENRKDKMGSSQESDEWPLPDIPQQNDYKILLALHETGSSDASQITTQVYKPPQPDIPKVFGLRNSIKSQDSEPWPSPPSSIQELLLIGNVETHYITPPEEACKVLVDSNTVSTYDDSNSENENKTLDVDIERSNTASDPTYENVAPDTTEQISEAISDSLSTGPSGVKIVLDKKSGSSSNSNSDELNISNLNDDVFVDSVEVARNELRPPTAIRRSTNSDDSSHSGHKTEIRLSSRKGSHSSYSEEDCTSSMGTNLEDGTVRLAIKPTKCTHSSHSEDTSIALSLSEWSNSTNTVKFQNLSTSNSGATKSSTSGLKSDDNSLADIAQSISEWSSSNSKIQSSSLQFQKLSSSASTGDSSTLTEFIPTISERSSSDTSKTLVPQKFFTVRQSVSRLGSSIDDLDVPYDQKNIKSPQNILSEDFSIASTSLPIKSFQEDQKTYTKSTERPVVIPVQFFSDTENGGSVEQRSEKLQFFHKYPTFTRSNERPVKVPLSKCSPYYSSSLSSESTPVPSTKALTVSKTATVPLTRSHRKPVSRNIFQAKSPPSENDSTSSMESPKSTPESRDRRGYRRRRQVPQKRHKTEKHSKDEYFYVEQEPLEYDSYLRGRNIEDLTSAFQYENVLTEENVILQSVYSETLEEGYYPDGDSQSGSDIFRMEREDDSLNERYELVEGFDVSSIPPPLLEDDFEDDRALEV